MLIKIYTLACFLVVQMSSVALASTNPVLIVSNKVHNVRLSKDDVKEVFLGTRTIIDGWRVLPLDQESSSPVRDEFYLALAGKDATEMKVYWAEQIFSGKARAPQVAQNDQTIIQRVIDDPNAIGYVRPSADTSKVNVLFRLE